MNDEELERRRTLGALVSFVGNVVVWAAILSGYTNTATFAVSIVTIAGVAMWFSSDRKLKNPSENTPQTTLSDFAEADQQ